MLNWGNPKQPEDEIMNIEERVYQDIAVELLQEVSLSFPVATELNPAVSEPPIQMEIPVSSSQNEETESAELGELCTRFAPLKSSSVVMPILSIGFQFAGNKMNVSNPPILNMSSTTRDSYPGLDGHLR